MKSFKSFLSESVNISGDFNGNLYINSAEQQQVDEKYSADVEWNGELYQIELVKEGEIPTRNQLTEMLQGDYPGAIVQNVYPIARTSNSLNITSSKKVTHQGPYLA
ncbi:hypothetical protein SSZBM1_191 [Synechococcus phage S-SZBM1]|uniref:Uncharacterized protein n=1 Tax=Synechococcus phage S-SZBM1 TaxID=2926475 RepID=A0AC61TST9_9CAUD|nr:hypothetical protein PP650_gp085 [Synechococcus phage S-SZBM1]UNH61308.1 hypothetical protein SSZBM1_191 [Synechococcus phage S-SZBM1]